MTDGWQQLRSEIQDLWFDTLPNNEDFTLEEWSVWCGDVEGKEPSWPNKDINSLMYEFLNKMQELEHKNARCVGNFSNKSL